MSDIMTELRAIAVAMIENTRMVHSTLPSYAKVIAEIHKVFGGRIDADGDWRYAYKGGGDVWGRHDKIVRCIKDICPYLVVNGNWSKEYGIVDIDVIGFDELNHMIGKSFMDFFTLLASEPRYAEFFGMITSATHLPSFSVESDVGNSALANMRELARLFGVKCWSSGHKNQVTIYMELPRR